MKEIDEDLIKTEIDAIANRIDSIMRDVEKIVPSKKEEAPVSDPPAAPPD